MKYALIVAGAVAAGLLFLTACTPHTPPAGVTPSGGMVMTSTIQITNSGATDSIGFRVLIGTGGEASFVSGDGSGHATLPAELYERIVHDIAVSKPLSGLPSAASCMKPVSFGTSTFVSIGGDRSPDLTCPANEEAASLKSDAAAIVSFLKIRNVPRGQGKDLPPQKF